MKLNEFVGLFGSHDRIVIKDITDASKRKELHDGYVRDIKMSEYDMESFKVVQSRVFYNGLIILVKKMEIGGRLNV